MLGRQQSGNTIIPGDQDRLGSSFLSTRMVIHALEWLQGAARWEFLKCLRYYPFFCRATERFQRDPSVGVAMQRTCLAPHLQNLQLRKAQSPFLSPHSILFSAWLSIIPKSGIISSPDRTSVKKDKNASGAPGIAEIGFRQEIEPISQGSLLFVARMPGKREGIDRGMVVRLQKRGTDVRAPNFHPYVT